VKSLSDVLAARIIDGRFRMNEVDPDSTPGAKSKRQFQSDIDKQRKVLLNLQERLYAEQKRSVLVVLQAMDTGGKDGTITHVFSGLNPQGVEITSFKEPTPEEKQHGFLWRIKQHLPLPGRIGIFNRSQYEDVLVTRVKDLVPPAVVERRYEKINRFERNLTKSGTKVIKICLHISYEEQGARFLDRLEDPDKRWKFSENDVNVRSYWDDYQSAYGIAITKCTTKWAPWYVIPANNKDYRNWAVTGLLIEQLKEMDPRYPKVKLNVARLKKKLKA